MKRFVAGLLLALLIMPLAAAAGERHHMRSVTVTGTGKVAAAPDIAYVQVGVVSLAPTADAALDENNVAMQRVFDTLKRRGIAERDMQTITLNLMPQYERQNKQTDVLKIIGYRVDNNLRVTVRDLDSLGSVLDDLVSQGANALQGISFDVADRETLADEARRSAMANAQHKAELYAQTGGFALGAVISVEEQGGFPTPRPMQMARAMAAEAVPVAPGEQEYSVDVLVRFAIE